MFNWLFKKYLTQITPEQQLAKDVEEQYQSLMEELQKVREMLEEEQRKSEELYKLLMEE